jgi:predicted RNA-binding protein with PUA-like domain
MAKQRWLVKSEPESYSFSDLVRDGRTTWDGVRNALAQSHLRSMKPGDDVFVYHTGSEKSVVGLARVAAAPKPDPAGGAKAVAVELEAVRPLAAPVALSAIREDPACAELPLVRAPRLSVMPIPAEAWDAILRRSAARVA